MPICQRRDMNPEPDQFFCFCGESFPVLDALDTHIEELVADSGHGYDGQRTIRVAAMRRDESLAPIRGFGE